MKRFTFLAAATALTVFAGANFVVAQAAPVQYVLPDETATLKPGVNQDLAMNNCTACHSADYILTQPRGPKFKKEFWTKEVTKMIKVYGAPINDPDADKIIEYLTENY